MEAKFNFVHYKIVKYILNSEVGKYEKQPEKVQFLKLPYYLKVEQTQEEKLKQQGAELIITSGFKNKKREFFSGLIPFSQNIFIGNDYEYINGEKKNSLCVFVFSNDNKTLTVYYFNRFYKERREERFKYVSSFIEHIRETL